MSRHLQARPRELQADIFPSRPHLLARGASEHTMGSIQGAEAPRLNARAVELIASPDRGEKLRASICEQLVPVLRKRPGFECAFLMRSHDEPRRVVVVTLWQTQRQATGTRWETETAFRRLVAPMLDLCARVQTYEAFWPVAAVAATATRGTDRHLLSIHRADIDPSESLAT